MHGRAGRDQRGDGRLPAGVLPGGAGRVGGAHAGPGGRWRRLAEHERAGAADRGQRPGPGPARVQLRRRRIRAGVPSQRDRGAGDRAHRPQRLRHRAAACWSRPRRACPDGGRSASPRTRRRARGRRCRSRRGCPRTPARCRAMLLRTCEFVDNRHTQDPGADSVGRGGHDLAHRLSDLPGHLGRRGLRPGTCPAARARRATAGRTCSLGWSSTVDGPAPSCAAPARTGWGRTASASPATRPDPADDAFERILPSPQHVPVIVAGSRNAAMSMVVRVFGLWSGQAVAVEGEA